MKACSSCGFENADEDRFCAQCGNALAAPPPDTLPAPPPPVQPGPRVLVPTSSGQVDPSLKIIILIGTIFIPLLGIIMGAIYRNDPSPEKKAVGKLWLGVGIGMAVLYFLWFCRGGSSV